MDCLIFVTFTSNGYTHTLFCMSFCEKSTSFFFDRQTHFWRITVAKRCTILIWLYFHKYTYIINFRATVYGTITFPTLNTCKICFSKNYDFCSFQIHIKNDITGKLLYKLSSFFILFKRSEFSPHFRRIFCWHTTPHFRPNLSTKQNISHASGIKKYSHSIFLFKFFCFFFLFRDRFNFNIFW